MKRNQVKTNSGLLVVGMMAAWYCSIGNAQISYTNSLVGATLIYSNSFTGGAVNITNTPPDYAVSRFGGTNNAVWINAGGTGDTGVMYANGSVTTTLGDSWLLPFKAQNNYVYTLTAAVNFTGNPGSWVVAGFAQNYSTPGIANSAPNGTGVNGFGWTLRNWSGNTEFFAGANGGNNVYNNTPAGPVGNGTYTFTQILDTTASKWVINSFFNGVQLGPIYTFAANPSIGAVMIGQHALGNPSAYTYTSLTLSAAPIVILQQPVSAGVGVGTAFTNRVVVAATTPAYQWFKGGVPINGATNAYVTFNPVATGDAGTNYYVVITNSLGSITSAVASLTVYTNPVFAAAYPTAYTNPITLFGGTQVSGTNYAGSSPTFSVSTLGAQPITYQWLTNGVAVGGATGASFTVTNCQLSSPTGFACIASNSYGMATNAWSVSYAQAPMAPYPQTVLAYQPLGYWRLNEGPDDGLGDPGVLALDYGSGNNGVYTNAVLGASGYSLTEPGISAAYFASFASLDSDAFNILGVDFRAPAGNNAIFSVTAWVLSGGTLTSGAGILAKGYGGAEQFVLDVSGGFYRFAVRDAAGNLYSATATIGPTTGWDFLVGVCDEAHGKVTLYVNGVPRASAAIAPGSGLLASSVPMTIGARSSAPWTGQNDLQFKGYVNDVAIFNSALSIDQEAILYTAAGYSIVPFFVQPPANFVYQANKTLTIPASAFGTTNYGYYWINVTKGGLLGSGAINTFATLDATLTIPNASPSLSGDQLELVITNDTSFNNWFVTLFCPPPPVTLDYSDPILYSNYFNGGTWSIAGMPLTAANALVGGTNATWVNALGTNDAGILQASGVDATTALDSWVLPFTPHAGYVYTLDASVTFTGDPGNWIGLGFAARVPTNAALGFGRFTDGGTAPPLQGPDGYDWLILRPTSANEQWFAGPHGTPSAGTASGNVVSATGTWELQLILDTTAPQWVISCFVNGTQFGANYTYPANPPIGAVGITQTGVTAPGYVQWNYFALSQVAPGGVPPYLLAPLPPTNVTLLADMPLSIPVSAFGSVPVGYYWSNTTTVAVLGSGTTNNVAPLVANLSVSDVPFSWNGNTLVLVVTNAYGTNISRVSLTVTNAVNPKPGPIQVSLAGGLLSLSWPTNMGWTLQAQTNSPGVGLGTNWVIVPGSTAITNLVVPVSPTNGSVFYRLRL
jgi:hypothetical protein